MLLMLVAIEESSYRARKAHTVDEGLLLRMANGEASALEALYAQAKTAVYGFALSILKNAADAEDVMQETFVTLFTKADSYQPQGKPMAWILTITRNHALMRLRGKGREADLADYENTLAARPFEPNSLDRLVLRAAFTTLSDQERQIIILHCVSGQKHREIASLLELPLGTVLSKYSRALSKLQKKIQEEEAS